MSNQVQEFERKEIVTPGAGNTPVGKILVVDDEPELREVLVDSLKIHGFEATGCGSGRSALTNLLKRDFDLLLTDLMMPEMDGIALLKAALEIDPHLVGIIVTGQGTIQTAVDAMQMGAFDYVLKPFRMQTLMPVLTRAMNVRHLKLENVQLRETVAIHSLCQTIAFTLDEQTVLSRLADAALEQSDADEVSVLLPTNDCKELYVAAVRGEKRERLLGERVPLQSSISSWVARERMPLILNGPVRDERFVALWPRPEIRSAVSVPMQVANKLVGIINLNVTNRLRPFTLGQMKALSILASTAAAALESASLYAKVQQAENNYRSIFENAVEGVFQSTPEGRFITVNPSMARILGYESPEEVITTITDINRQLYVDPESRAKAFQIQEETGVLHGFEFEAYRKDGGKIWLSVNQRSVRDHNGTEIYREGSIEDITERRRVEERRARRSVQALFRADVSAALAMSSAPLRDTLELCTAAMVQHLDAAFARIWTLNRSEDLLELQASSGIYTHIDGPHSSIPVGSFKIGKIAKERAPHITNEVQTDPRVSDKEWATREGMVAFAGYPLLLEDRLLGVMALFSRTKLAEDTIDALASVADLISQGIERKQTEKALRESEERYRDLIENAHDLIYEHDLKGNYTSINRAGKRTTGYSLEESLKMNLEETVAPEYLERAKEMLRRKMAGEKVTAYDLEIVAKDGHRVAVEVNTRLVLKDGVPVGVQGIARDITERKRAEEALRDSEARYRLLFESNPQPMWVYDLETLAFLAVNESAVNHYGYSREEFLAMTIKDIRPAEDIPALYDAIDRNSDKLRAAGVWKHRKQDGTIIEVEITSHLLVFDDRRAELILAHDVTETNRLEAALLVSEEQLRQSQKLEAIGQLAGGVAHDFNNLLTVIGGYSSILLGKLPQESPHRSSIEEIKKASDRASALTRQLLAFSRKQILQPKVLDLNTAVTDLEKMLRRLIGEDIDLLTITSPTLGKVKADPGQIEQVLLNLIVNARDAMPKGGKLTIETRNVVHSEEYAQRHAAVAGRYVMLAVSDTGCGMDAAIQPRVFEPFFTTKSSGHGTGLGLATVYGIVKQSGGNIWVYSEVGRGSTFKIYLPRVDDKTEADEVVVSKLIPKGTELVLLVEDEEQVRAILKHILEDQGYVVLAASNGEEALSLSGDLTRDIKLMITDVVMPQMSGRELAERVLEVRPDLPVLFMSGYTDDAIVRHGLLDEKLNFIQKPFDSAVVARKVREVLDSHAEQLL